MADVTVSETEVRVTRPDTLSRIKSRVGRDLQIIDRGVKSVVESIALSSGEKKIQAGARALQTMAEKTADGKDLSPMEEQLASVAERFVNLRRKERAQSEQAASENPSVQESSPTEDNFKGLTEEYEHKGVPIPELAATEDLPKVQLPDLQDKVADLENQILMVRQAGGENSPEMGQLKKQLRQTGEELGMNTQANGEQDHSTNQQEPSLGIRKIEEEGPNWEEGVEPGVSGDKSPIHSEGIRPTEPEGPDWEESVEPGAAPGETATPETPPQPLTPETTLEDSKKHERLAMIETAKLDLEKKRQEYIQARAITRSFWRNLWGNLRSGFGLRDNVNSPSQQREATRVAYEMSVNEYAQLSGTEVLRDKGIKLAEMPTPLPDDSSEEDMKIYEEEVKKVELQRRTYDTQLVAELIKILDNERFTLDKADFELSAKNRPELIKILERMSKNPYLRIAVAGGLGVSTLTGFAPGMIGFGALQAAINTAGVKGGLDAITQFYSGRALEGSNLTPDQVAKMSTEERQARLAALGEVGIKRGRLESTDAEVTLEDQERQARDKRIREIIANNGITADSPEARTKIIAQLLAENNLNDATDQRIDSNRNWNSARWVAALGIVGSIGWLTSGGGETPPPTPPESYQAIPWETMPVDGDNLSWNGMVDGMLGRYFYGDQFDMRNLDQINNMKASPGYAEAQRAIFEEITRLNPNGMTPELGKSYDLPLSIDKIVGPILSRTI